MKTVASIVIAAATSVLGSDLICVILFGSAGNGTNTALSDVDVLAVSRNAVAAPRKTLTESGISVDLNALSVDQVFGALTQDQWKDNFVLLALVTGRAIFDVDGVYLSMKEVANRVWQNGPTLLDRGAALRLSEGAKKFREAALKLGERFEESRRAGGRVDELSRLHLHFILLTLSTMYMRVRGRWVFPPWVLENMPDPVYVEIRTHCSVVLKAKSPVAESRLISQLAQEVIHRAHIASENLI